MTEQEFEKLDSQGKVEEVSKEIAQSSASSEMTPVSVEEFITVLEALRRPKKHVTGIPTFDPQHFADQIQLIDDGSKKLAIYINGGWETFGSSPITQIAHEEVDSAANFSILDLAGDEDGMYKLVIRAVFNTVESVLHLRFNNDNGSNYYIQGSTSAQTEMQMSNGTAKHFLIECLIHPKSGIERLAIINQVYFEDNATHASQIREGIWTNTADEITSLLVTAGQNFLEGSEYWLYKLN